MKLIFLHGPPASGKLTISKQIQARTGAKIFYNHLTIDVARSIFDFGSEEFWSLVRELRLTCFKVAAKRGEGIVIFTSCYDHPTDFKFFEQIAAVMSSGGSQLFPVYLKCQVAELEKRVSASSRAELGKVASIEGLRSSLREWNCVAVPSGNCVTIMTDNKTPEQCAEEIIETLELSK